MTPSLPRLPRLDATGPPDNRLFDDGEAQVGL
jgi:hypothetical protein